MKRKLINRLAGAMGRLLTLGRPDEVSLEEVRGLQQTNEVWESAVRLARVWITPPDETPYRPYIVLTVSSSGQIIGSEVFDEVPSPAKIINALAKAMRYPVPSAGGKRRPTVIHMDDEALVEALAPKLKEVGIRCAYRHTLRYAEHALSEVDRFMGDEEPIPSLLKGPGVTPFMGRGLFKAAAYFYREAPWRWLDDSHPIEVHYPADGRPRYAVVMGHGGETYGLAAYDSMDVLRKTYAGMPPQELIQEAQWTAMIFGTMIEMPFDDLDDIVTYDWPVAGEDAYPLFIRFTSTGQPLRPGKKDLLWFEAALLALPTFVRDKMQADAGFLRPSEEVMTVDMADGEDRITLCYPVPGFEVPHELEHAELREDLEQRVGAALERNRELLRIFARWLENQGLSEGTIQKHLKNAEVFANDYMAAEGGSWGNPRPADQAEAVEVDDFLSGWFIYDGEGASVEAMKAIIASLKKFYTCLQKTEEASTSNVGELLELLKTDRDYYVGLARDYE